MTGRDLFQSLRLMAAVAGIVAAGCETATGLGIDRRYQFTPEQDTLLLVQNIRRRNRRQ